MGIPFIIGASQQKRHHGEYLGFDTFVAPDDFDINAQNVNIYEIFNQYRWTNSEAKCIYSISDTITSLTFNRYLGQNNVWPCATSYRYGYTSGGVDYKFDTGAYTTIRGGGPNGNYTRINATDVSSFPDSGTIRIKNVSNFVYTSLDKTPGNNAFIGTSQPITQLNDGYAIDLTVTVDFTGTTKRWVICNHLTTGYQPCLSVALPAIGSEWLYCGDTIQSISASRQTYLKYIHIHNLQTITSYGQMENLGATALTGTLYLSRNATIVGNYSFQGCTNITKVIIPKEWTTTGGMTWRSCSKLATVVFEEQSSLVTIGQYAFEYTAIDHPLVIPDTVKTIGNRAFTGNTKIPSLTLGSSVETIAAAAFTGCTSMTGTLTIPASCKTIGDAAFTSTMFTSIVSYSSYIEDDDNVLYDLYEAGQVKAIYGAKGYSGTLTLRNDTTQIRTEAFHSNTLRTGNLTIPNTVTYIYSWAFYNCTGFNGYTLSLSNTLTVMETRCFQNIYFPSITIPDSVQTIGEFCFYTAPTTLVIGSGLTSVGITSFNLANCTSLTGGSTSYPISDHVWYNCKTSGKVIAWDSAKKYVGSLTLRSDTTEISAYVFYNSYRTGTLNIPATVTTIGDRAFQLTAFDNVTSSNTTFPAADYVLYNVSSGVVAIYGAKGKTGIALVLRNDTTKINDYAFYLNSWTSANIPNTVTNINTYAFWGCTSISVYNIYCSAAPVIAGTPFSNYAKPLHVPVSNSGYNVAPWTNTAIFSSIINDL